MLKDTHQINDTFKKREFVITTAGDYPQDVMLQVVQDKCDILNSYAVGQAVKVDWNLRGREWTSPTNEVKYFTTLEAWKIERSQGAPQQQPAATQQAAPKAEPFPLGSGSQPDEDDLPF